MQIQTPLVPQAVDAISNSLPVPLEVIYQTESALSVDDYVDVLRRSTLGERRPLDDPDRLKRMLAYANLMVTARTPEGRLIGIARSVTDFAFCCYVSDLAVDTAYQRQGIGRRLIAHTRQAIGLQTQLLLLAAPAAEKYYPHIGFRHVPNAWSIDAGEVFHAV